MLHRRQKEGSEFPALLIGADQIILFQQQSEESLRQILRLISIVAFPPDEGVDRTPIGLAQRGQRLARIRGGI
jgi:hypothetical protein